MVCIPWSSLITTAHLAVVLTWLTLARHGNAAVLMSGQTVTVVVVGQKGCCEVRCIVCGHLPAPSLSLSPGGCSGARLPVRPTAAAEPSHLPASHRALLLPTLLSDPACIHSHHIFPPLVTPSIDPLHTRSNCRRCQLCPQTARSEPLLGSSREDDFVHHHHGS